MRIFYVIICYMTTYDIVYSLTVHEQPDVINNTLQNIKKYNNNNNILIILHANIKIYVTFLPTDDIKSITLINPKPYNKKGGTMSLTKAHLDNYEYLLSIGIKFKYMMLLASNCMFCKQMPKMADIIPTAISDRRYKRDVEVIHPKGWCHWPAFYNNNIMRSVMRNDKIEYVYAQHEGFVMSWDLVKNINKYMRKNNFFNIVECETVFEEIIFPSLEKYFQGNVGNRYCKIYWQNWNIDATIDDIKQLQNINNDVYIVKRVPRDLNSEVRKFLSE